MWCTEDISPASTGLEAAFVVDRDGTPEIQRAPIVGYLRQRNGATGSIRFVPAVLAGDEVIPAETALRDTSHFTIDPAVGIGIYAVGASIPADDLIGPVSRLASEIRKMEIACAA